MRRYNYTTADVQRMVERNRREKGRFNATVERARLLRERDFAQQTGDIATAAECVLLTPPCPLV